MPYKLKLLKSVLWIRWLSKSIIWCTKRQDIAIIISSNKRGYTNIEKANLVVICLGSSHLVVSIRQRIFDGRMRSRCFVQALSCVPASGLSRSAAINTVCWSSFSAGSSSFLQQSATMKRRNALDGKSRRPVKRTNKISENFYGRLVSLNF